MTTAHQITSEATAATPPKWLVLVINNFCNLRCRMCDVGIHETASAFFAHLVGPNPQNMTAALLHEVLDQAATFSPRPRIGLAYTEPLIHANITDFCKSIVHRGFHCAITTNGFLLPRLAHHLVEIGVQEITVSVDGPAQVHDRIRGRSGSFEALYRGIEELGRAKARLGAPKPTVRFSYTITDMNYTAMLEFLQATEALDTESFIFSHLNFISDDMAARHNAFHHGEWAMARSNLGAMDLAAIDLDAMWHALQELKLYGKERMLSLTIVPDLDSPEELEVYYRQPLRFVGGLACTDPWRMILIKTDGTVIPAHGRCYNVPVGNLTERSLADIWNGARFQRSFRRTLRDAGGTLPACARCCGVIGKPREGPEHFV